MGGNGRVSICTVGCDREVDIATHYGLDCLGIESRWGRKFSTFVQTDLRAHPAFCTMVIACLSRG